MTQAQPQNPRISSVTEAAVGRRDTIEGAAQPQKPGTPSVTEAAVGRRETVEGAAQPKYPGIPSVINGNGAVAHVMSHVCGGVIGYPITPSTEISELYEATRAEGAVNVWGKYPFFFSPEGEHSAQSGALGAALTGGQFVSNASSSQGILYAMESHYVTVGKKIGGFVLQVAARVVSKHSLNVMAGHDDVYALLSSGYTVLFGANPQEAADLAAISYRTSALSLIPVTNAMDGFSTSHMLSGAVLPEPELLKEYLGDPAGRIECPTVAQEMLFGSKGRVAQLEAWLGRQAGDFMPDALASLRDWLSDNDTRVEGDNDGLLVPETYAWVPVELQGQWRRQWRGAHEKGTRAMVPALVDVNNPGMTGPVQNQPDFQAGAVDHRTHFAVAVPELVRRAMGEYAELTGREYTPVHCYDVDDADIVFVGLGSVTDDLRAVLPYLRAQGIKVGVVAIKLLQPFPEAEVVSALAGKRAVTVLERSDHTALTTLVQQAMFKARENADNAEHTNSSSDAGNTTNTDNTTNTSAADRHPGIPALTAMPQLTTAIFGLGGHDLQPRHLIAAAKAMDAGTMAPLVYLGSQFFDEVAASENPESAALQARLREAYPETQAMALATEENPNLLPDTAMRIRFHSVGGYGTIATGKLLTDILAGALSMYSKSAPKYGSEKSGAATNYYITLSPEPVLVTNAELEDVEVVISPDHRVFAHANPLKGLTEGGTFILQSSADPLDVWRELPRSARKTIREKGIRLVVIDAFSVAKRHAPSPNLETRMMGIAFIGAVVGHVPQVAAGASQDDVLDKVRAQIAKKFGSKGAAVTEGNLAVIREGLEVAQVVDYDAPQFRELDSRPEMLPLLTVGVSERMCECSGSAGCNGLFDRGYYEEIVARPFREGTIGEAPVMPGVGLFMPAGTAAGKDKGMFRRTVPAFVPELCTGCMECTLVCPDAAIPNSVHDIHDLLLTGIEQLSVPESQKAALRSQVYVLSERVREAYRNKDERGLGEILSEASLDLAHGDRVLGRNLDQLAYALAAFPVARTRPFFDSPEKAGHGTGGLFSAVIDPWKCTGCLECIEVCGPDALVARDQDQALLTTLQERFSFLSATPNTPARFHAEATEPGGDTKRLFLDRANYYATTGGHGGCRGCGEVTAIRLVMATSHALGDKRRSAHMAALEALLEQLDTKIDALAASGNGSAPRVSRLSAARDTLEQRLYNVESGPTGKGPSTTVIANSTGCSSVYASTMPYNPYQDPWVNSLFQDAQPLAKGIFEGISAQLVDDVRALRVAELELTDSYEPAVHDTALQRLGWADFTPEEMALLPTVMTIGGDGATYDIGFGALSRVLASDTPLKVLVLNTGAYSNTGGQASTSSFTAQDSDLARFGEHSEGKSETRKELGLLASFHPNVFVCSTSPGMQGHFLKATMEFLTYGDAPAVMDVYTPCQGEHGIADSAASGAGRLAVESRMNPVFIHDPRRGDTLHEWFDLSGNPDPESTWTTTMLEYVDDSGAAALLEVPLTPAHFALGEGRFRKQFRPLRPEEEAGAVPIHEYVELSVSQRTGATPYVLTADPAKRLVKVVCSAAVVELVEERRRYWHMLQYLAGTHISALTSLHADDIEALQAKYDEAVQAREAAIDDIASAMSALATSSKRAPVGGPGFAGFGGLGGPGGLGGVSAGGSGGAAAAPAAVGGGVAVAEAPASGLPIHLDPADVHLCNDCKTCYQELPQLFERTTQIIEGEARQVARMIPGAIEKVEITPELEKRMAQVKASCDGEIIR